MALPVLDAVFASSADLPRRQLLSEWLVEQLGSGSIADFSTLPERYLYAKIAVSLGGPRTEQEYIELPKSYAWSDIYGAIIFNRTAPAAPSSLTLTPLTSSSIKLDWVTNGASVAYSVERSVDGAAFQVIGTTAIGATTATNTGLSIASNYQLPKNLQAGLLSESRQGAYDIELGHAEILSTGLTTGSARVTSQQAISMRDEPISAYTSPPH